MPIVPNTTTQTSHALIIQANGSQQTNVTVGAVNEWAPTQTMQVTPMFQFGHGTLDGVTGPYGSKFGAPYEKVPGNITGMQIRATRYDLFPIQMETAFGTLDMEMLSADPGMTNGGTGHLDLTERWFAPANRQPYRWQYRGCWFSEIGRTLSASNDRIVNVNATIEYTERRRVIG